MNSKNIPAHARAHLERVKELQCSVCDAPGPSDAHHVWQRQHYTCIALCKECHQGPILGIHGQRAAWKVRKLDEWSALNVTIQRLA